MPLQMPEAHRESACSCTVQVSTEILMTGRLCQSVPYMVGVPLHMLERPVSECIGLQSSRARNFDIKIN